MKRISLVQLTILWLCIAWLIFVLLPLVNMWAWSGLHPNSFSQEQLDTWMFPARRLREMDDRFRVERNGYLFKIGPAVLVLFVVLFRISVKPDIHGERPSEPATPAPHR